MKILDSPASTILATNSLGARYATGKVLAGKKRGSDGDQDVAALDAHGIGGDRVLGQFQAFAAAQVEVVLVEGRSHDHAVAQAAHQAARQHAGAGLRVDVVDGVDGAVAAFDVEYRHVAAAHQRADAG